MTVIAKTCVCESLKIDNKKPRSVVTNDQHL